MTHHRLRFVKTRVWNTEDNPGHFPELDDHAGLKVPWLTEERRKFGVAFSGGGTRSASATLGQLRGLKHAGLLDQVGYISAVSGGSWAATPFTYLPDNFDEDTFLGVARNPEELEPDDFDDAPSGSLVRAIADSVITDDFLIEAAKLSGDETYSRAVGNIFLKPFGLDEIDRFFTFHEGARDAAVEGNSRADDGRYFLSPDDFYLAREGRPYLVLGGTILRLDNSGDSRQKIQCEYTPLYTGVRKLFPTAGRRRTPIGGGYVESFAYDSKNPRERWGNQRWLVKLGRRRHRLTLSDIIGSSGAAPEGKLARIGLNFIGFPEFEHWPIHDISGIDEEEYGHGDGGLLENLGLMPLLARKVENIILFVNTLAPFDPGNPDPKKHFADSIAPLFNPVPDHDDPSSGNDFAVNVVFENGTDRLHDLIEGLRQRQAAGQALIHCDTYDVKDNDHYKIANYQARICWIYNENADQWRSALNPQVRSLLEEAEFARFPHYRTFFENPPSVIDLSRRQVNALAHLSCWGVVTSGDEIRSHFGL
ncbi:MAG: hypothetical protein ACE5EM_06665 [Sphingomonadales bacterium]